MSTPIDLGRFIQRRHFRAYERDLARGTYAFGVDVRRVRWLTTSAIGQATLRSIEHAWYRLADELIAGELGFPQRPEEIPLLDELATLCQLLHTTPPAVRLLAPEARASGQWAPVTPLGDPRSSDDWLVLDPDALARMDDGVRAFHLAAGLGHLQCGHGVLFIAHLVGQRRGLLGLYRRLLRPWSRLAAFSADRAGLLAVGDLDTALRALDTAAEPAWHPDSAPLAERRRALTEFAESAVVARIRTQRAAAGETRRSIEALIGALPDTDTDTEAAPPEPPAADAGVPDHAWTLARCDGRLTRRLRLF